MSSTAEDLLMRHRLTVRDYHRMAEAGILHEDSRVELIEGEIIDMAPIGSSHAGTVKRLLQLFDRAIGETAVLSIQDPIILGSRSEPQPDLALLRPRNDFYKNAHPEPGDVLLIVEVAESSLRYDREVKIPLYARHGVTEVWLVDLQNKGLTLFRRPEGGAYQDVAAPAALSAVTPALMPDIVLDLSVLF
jgi:Uma2 family endonuclease